MNQLVTEAIILSRTEYGEADRIISMLTPQQGKVRLMAKGVRRVKSKLAGGIELFSVSNITYIQGRKDLGTLISARLGHHYGNIVKDIHRTMLGYELIKRLDKATEDEPEEEYYHLLKAGFAALEDSTIDIVLVRLWFMMQLLRLGGHTPNLQTDIAGDKLLPASNYSFSFEDMTFAASPNGPFNANHIKFLRLGFAGYPPKALGQIQGSGELASQLMPLVQTMLQTYIRG
jgi:DNA repair protein RecO (recombination protein O)